MSDDLRARLTALVENWRSSPALMRNMFTPAQAATYAQCAGELRALLADPAPEAAREVGRCGDRLPPLTPTRLASFCRLPHGHPGWHEGDDGSEWTADLPVATGVTTEDEGPEPCAVQFCSALRTQGKFCDRHAYKNPVSCEHGELLSDPCAECHFDANADAAPAPVVSAGEEGVGLREDEREALADAVERILAARVAEAGARALEEAAKWMDGEEFVRPEDSAYINESHWNDSIADAVAVLYDRAYRLRGQR